MLRQITLIITCLVGSWQLSEAQDPIFSQFYAAPLQLNPAFAGNTYAPRININYRNQWPDLNNAYITYAASFDQFLENLNSGFGLMILSDDAGQGLLKTNKISGFYSYRLQVDRDFFIKFGVEGSLIQTRFDWDQYLFGDAIDPTFGSVSPGGLPYPTEEIRPESLSKAYFDISSGLLLYNPFFYAGVSVKHMNTPDEAILGVNSNLNTGLPMRLTAHGGMEITLREGNKRRLPAFVSPNIMFIKQGDFGQLNVGAYGSLGFAFVGAWYRYTFTNADAAIVLAGVQQGIFKIAYSYDVTISGLSGKTGGSHEISLVINFDLNRPRRIDYNDCFRMFR